MTEDDLDVRYFYLSPRHLHHFLADESAQAKIAKRVDELDRSGRIAGKTPIINLQTHLNIVEVHDGNASLVAWLIHVRRMRVASSLGRLKAAFDKLVVLHDRRHDNGEVWHPFVPAEVRCSDRLQKVVDEEQGNVTCKAQTLEDMPVYFNDTEYFSGLDVAPELGSVIEELEQAILN